MTDSFTEAIRALRCADARYPWIRPDEEEAEVADVLEATEHLHRPHDDTCTTCRAPWPCHAWRVAEALCMEWLIRGTNRYADHAEQVLARTRRTT